MGYWSEHPMGGDTPMDLTSALLNRFTDTDKDICYFENPNLAALIEENFVSVLEEAESTKNFTLPWLCLDYKVNVPLEYIGRLKALIDDGGGMARGYTGEEKESPQQWAEILYANFEKYLEDSESYEGMLVCPGLFSTIVEAMAVQDPGLINTK